MSDTFYHFVSSLRQGLAASIEKLPDDGQKRVDIDVSVHAQRRKIGFNEWDTSTGALQRRVQLYGPCDVETFHSRIVVRTDPKPNAGNFEPNYFPAVEFADPDFPWRYSPEPAKAGGSSQPADADALTPWIALVVLVAEDRGEDIRREFIDLKRQRNQRPAIRVHDQTKLPNPAFAWRWAHVQATTGTASLIDDTAADLTDEQKCRMNAEAIEALFTARPELVASRLLCPRRLAPKTLYRAFVVPTYKFGWATALGTPEARAHAEGAKATDLAWDNTSGEPIDLPYFFDWEFRTSVRGDFESLVRLLEGRRMPGLGLRDMDCEHPGFGLTVELPGIESVGSHRLGLEGALQSPNLSYTPWGMDKPGNPLPEPFQAELAEKVLNRANVEPRVVVPNGYGDGKFEDFSVSILENGKSVRVSWRTVSRNSCTLDYGPEELAGGTAYTIQVQTGPSVTQHSVTIDLIPEITYHLRIWPTSDVGAVTSERYITVRVPLPAVVPPIYGRWHAAVSKVEITSNHWIHVLNLDPRHRAAAGVGAEVVRKQQEALMASAWDQIGAIESANDMLRRAQFGRESSHFLHQRLGAMALEDYLRVSGPMHKRVVRPDNTGKRRTVASELAEQTRIPASSISPAFRRIARARGRIGKQSTRRMDLLTRLADGTLAAAGPAPTLPGTLEPGDISRELRDSIANELVPGIDFAVSEIQVNTNTKSFHVGLRWSSSNSTSCNASGLWSGTKLASGTELVGPIPYMVPILEWPDGSVSDNGGGPVITGWDPIPGPFVFDLNCEGAFGSIEAKIEVTVDHDGSASWTVETSQPHITMSDDQITFCVTPPDGEIITANMPETPEGIGGGNDEVTIAVSGALQALKPEPPMVLPPTRGAAFLEDLRSELHEQLNPATTIQERTRRRLNLHPGLNDRFEKEAAGDPLEEIMAYPEFPEPMYEPLREISQSLILPGVEKVPQNTVGLLETNGRFLESYMVGLNHEFAGELLWRRYPTDQRGSYFRQFWDVSEYVVHSKEAQLLLSGWLTSNGYSSVDDVERDKLVDIIRKDLATAAEAAATADMQAQLAANNISSLYDLERRELTELAESVIVREALDEQLKDIARIHQWGNNPLGENDNRKTNGKGESLVLIVRGDLLKRYPDALIYAIRGRVVSGDGNTLDQLMPQLAEFGGESGTPIFPIFRGSLGADLVFLGFPFDETAARSVKDETSGAYTETGIFFVIEERISEARFGLDATMSSEPPLRPWENLWWGDFDVNVGKFLDDTTEEPSANGENWDALTGAALRSRITLQKPARLVIHADQMLPEPIDV